MKKFLLLFSAVWLIFGSAVAQHDRCGTMQYHEYMKATDPSYEANQNAIEAAIQQRMIAN